MKNNEFNNKVLNASKWSSLLAITQKIITPITNMILARILLPEAFGVLATITMIISFTDMFTDAGFQKYLIQHEFIDDEQKFQYTNVAFYTNLLISIILFLLIIIFREKIAILVGNKGLGNVIAIASIQIILTSFSSIQIALYRRNFNFKVLFKVRLITITVPFVITIPLALMGLDYWSLIIGSIIIQLCNAIILTVKSKWKPTFFYSFKLLKNMLSFSIWSLVEAISIWLTSWLDALIIGKFLSEYYLGIYKTSTSMVNSLMGLITASIVPVLFATLSRLQNDNNKLKNIFYKFQLYVSMIAIPLGIGMYVFRDTATTILLGSQWKDANGVIGAWAISSVIVIVTAHFCSELYRAKGKPKVSVLVQLSHLALLIPICLISIRYSFMTFVYWRSFIRLQFIVVHFLILKFYFKFPITKFIANISIVGIMAIAMGALGYFLRGVGDGMLWTILSILICIIFYFTLLWIPRKTRNALKNLITKILLGSVKL